MSAIRIFISYSHEDEIWLKQWLDDKQKQRNRRYFLDFWKRSLRAENEECIFWWDGSENVGVRGGDRWQSRIFEEIDRAHVVVLLITQDFVISPFIKGEELPRILARAKRGDIEVLPVLLAPARWEKLELHGLFQLTPGKPTPLTRYLDAGEDDWQNARLEVAEALVAAVQRANGNRETPVSRPPRTSVALPIEPRILADNTPMRLPIHDTASSIPSSISHEPIQKTKQPRVQLVAISEIAAEPAVTEPSWASASGEDQYGYWADLTIDGATQRFRYIRPGTFKIGSPPEEPDRNQQGLESQHQVTLTKAYWMADSACTQGMWQAVTENNPTQRKSDLNHPVANVSWDDCQKFLHALNRIKIGLDARLPTEAEWEYACRGGTTTPFSCGTTITRERVNYYLEHGYTVAVKSMPCNPWGLFEMHGNVEEWCLDFFADYTKEPQTDPQGPPRRGAHIQNCGPRGTYNSRRFHAVEFSRRVPFRNPQRRDSSG